MITTMQSLFNRVFRRKQLDAMIHEMHYKDGRLDATMEFQGVSILADELGNIFDRAGGVNYVEFTVFNVAKMRTFVVTIQRKGGKTPAQVIEELRAEIEQLKGGAQ